jgi:hypothetical protein
MFVIYAWLQMIWVEGSMEVFFAISTLGCIARGGRVAGF